MKKSWVTILADIVQFLIGLWQGRQKKAAQAQKIETAKQEQKDAEADRPDDADVDAILERMSDHNSIAGRTKRGEPGDQ